MSSRNIFGVEISYDVVHLYKGLHLVHSEFDDSEYAQTVCSYYSTKINEVLKKTNITSFSSFQIDCGINDIDEIDIALDNLVLFFNLYVKLQESYNSNVDLTKYEVVFPSGIRFATDDFKSWINMANDAIDLLPRTKNYTSANIENNPFSIYFAEICKSYELDISKNNLHNYVFGDFEESVQYDEDDYLVRVCQAEENNTTDKPTSVSKKIARKLAQNYAEYHSNVIINENIVLDELLNVVREERLSKYALEKAKNDKKRNSFIIGGVFWGICLATLIIFLSLLKPNFFFNFTTDADGVWSNIWKCALTVICTMLVMVGFVSNATLGGKIIKITIVPKGLMTAFLIYNVYIFDLTGKVISGYIIPYKIIGTMCIIWTIVCGTADLYGGYSHSKRQKETRNFFVRCFDSNQRGRIFFANAMVIVPSIILFIFTRFFIYLAVPAVWVETIFMISLIIFACGRNVFEYHNHNLDKRR